MIISLLFLPIRIAINLFTMLLGLVTSVGFMLLKFIANNLMLALVIALALGVLGYCELRREEKAPAQLPKSTAPSVTVAPQLRGATKTAPAIRIDPVLQVEDGNSAFASDLYKAMTQAERAYYSQLFFWVMNSIVDGKSYVWNQGNINGTFTPTATFQNKLGSTCRKFKETLKVHTVQQTLDGTACYQGNNSWCKLKVNATPACGLGGKASTFEGIERSLKNLF